MDFQQVWCRNNQNKKKKEERQNKFMVQNDEEINSMLHNIDEIDNFIKNPEWNF